MAPNVNPYANKKRQTKNTWEEGGLHNVGRLEEGGEKSHRKKKTTKEEQREEKPTKGEEPAYKGGKQGGGGGGKHQKTFGGREGIGGIKS